MNVNEYVSRQLENASVRYLEEIVAHGVYNVDPKIEQGDSDEEYDAIDAVFRALAEEKLAEIEHD